MNGGLDFLLEEDMNQMKPAKIISFFFLLFFIFPGLLWALDGKVVGISDGDTITVLKDSRTTKIRLYGIDCPEKSQDFGRKTKQFTSNMVFGKDVKITSYGQDKYGRTIGLIYLDSNGQCLNEELIKNGYAWVYREYCKDGFCQKWLQYEQNARANKFGLWSGHNPISPWEFRYASNETLANKIVKTIIYHGNIKSQIFHRPGCRYYNCKNCVAEFDSREKAIQAGYRPCKICKP